MSEQELLSGDAGTGIVGCTVVPGTSPNAVWISLSGDCDMDVVGNRCFGTSEEGIRIHE